MIARRIGLGCMAGLALAAALGSPGAASPRPGQTIFVSRSMDGLSRPASAAGDRAFSWVGANGRYILDTVRLLVRYQPSSPDPGEDQWR